jgi:hypothetical protein
MMLEESAMYRRIVTIVAAAVLGMLVAGTSAQAAGLPVLAWLPTTSGSTYGFGTIDGVGGKTATQTFRLTNSGGSATGTLAAVALTNTSGAAFSITSDRCSGRILGPKKSCQVTVEYAPTTNGESDGATLTATGGHASASITLTGQGGTADLTLSPGTLTGTDSHGTNDYNHDFGLVGSGISDTQTFTVTNSGTGTSNTLQLASCCTTGFTLSNDQTSGRTLAPGGTATFDLTFSATCTVPTTFSTPLVVNGQSNDSPYISVTYTANCAPPITSVTATLGNLTVPGNPQFVSIGSGQHTPISVYGTLKNVSFNPPPSPGELGGRLHGFTIQIPFSITGRDPTTGSVLAATLNCDSSMLRSYSVGYPPSTCSVSNNVLTMTQNFPPSFTIQNWYPGFSKQIGYDYVGSSLPPGEDCCAYVTWSTPTVTAVH